MRISKLPIRLDLEKSAVPVVLNDSFLISEEGDLDITNNTGLKSEAIDEIRYQVSEDDAIWSNEGISIINDYVSENTPESTNEILASAEETQTNVLTPTDLIPVNTSTDRIKIVSYDTLNGLLEFNGNPVNPDDEFFNYDFTNLVIETFKGGGAPYQVINYKCGNHLGYNDATIYTVTVNVATLAEVEFLGRTTNSYNDGEFAVTEINDQIRINKGYIGLDATVDIDIVSPMFGVSTGSEVNIDDLVKTADENFVVAKTLDSDGSTIIDVKHIYRDTEGITTSSVVTFLLTLIDGDAGKVSGTNQYISTANFISAGAGAGITDYRSSYETDGYIYSGWNDTGVPYIRRTISGTTTNATGVTDLEPDWTNRLSLTYV